MRTVSDYYKNHIHDSSRKMSAYATILLKNGYSIGVGDCFGAVGDITGEMSVSTATSGESSFDVGAFVTGKSTLVLDNSYHKYDRYDFRGAIVVPYIGMFNEETTAMEWMKMGVYTVSKSPVSSKRITLTGLDNAYKFDKNYDGGITFPATLQTVVQYCCDSAGVEFASSGFYGSGLKVYTAPSSSTSLSKIIAAAAQMSGNYARINNDGALEIKWYNWDSTGATTMSTVETLDDDTEISATFDTHKITVTGVRITTSDTSYQLGTDGYVMQIKDNILMSPEMMKGSAGFIYGHVNGITLYGASVAAQGNPAVEAGDVMKCTINGYTIFTPITGCKHGISENSEYSCGVESEIENGSDNVKSPTEAAAAAQASSEQAATAAQAAQEQAATAATAAEAAQKAAEAATAAPLIFLCKDAPAQCPEGVIYAVPVGYNRNASFRFTANDITVGQSISITVDVNKTGESPTYKYRGQFSTSWSTDEPTSEGTYAVLGTAGVTVYEDLFTIRPA